MKCFLKILGAVAGILLAAKLLQILIDHLYENYGKRYITTESVE